MTAPVIELNFHLRSSLLMTGYTNTMQQTKRGLEFFLSVKNYPFISPCLAFLLALFFSISTSMSRSKKDTNFETLLKLLNNTINKFIVPGAC